MSLQDLRAGLPRAVRRHRALLAGGLAAAAVATALPALAPSPAPQVTVLAAARDLTAGTPLGADDLVRVALPAAVVPSGVLTEVATAVGQVLAGPVRSGEPLTDVRLVAASLVPRTGGVVAVPVRLADPGEAALLHAGDRVDVLATPPTGGRLAATVGVALRVLAVPPPGPADDGALVVLAAVPAVAAALAGAAASSRLSVTLLAS